DLRNSHAAERGLDHHLACELHPRRAQPQALERLPLVTAQPTVEVVHGAAEQEPPDAAQERVADVAVLPRHRPAADPSREAVAHHQLVTLPELLDEGPQVAEIIALVRVAHDDVLAAGGERAVVEGGAVA